MLVALDMGYQSCPYYWVQPEGVTKLIPADHVIGPMVAVGKGLKTMDQAQSTFRSLMLFSPFDSFLRTGVIENPWMV